jgi:tRNA dimethylallyltransferase
MLFVGLKASREKLADLIEKRVRKRLNMGLKDEIKNLLTRGVSWDSQAMSSLGYKEWKGYFTGNKTLSDVIDDWTRGEINYAKRQLVWFKRDSRINWYKTQNKHWLKNVEKKVKKWYSDTNE